MMLTDFKTLRPWPELHRDLSNMQSMRIVADGVVYDGEADVTLDPDTRVLTITVDGGVKKAKKK